MGPEVHNRPPQNMSPPQLNLSPAWLREGNAWANSLCSTPISMTEPHTQPDTEIIVEKICDNVCTKDAEVKNPAEEFSVLHNDSHSKCTSVLCNGRVDSQTITPHCLGNENEIIIGETSSGGEQWFNNVCNTSVPTTSSDQSKEAGTKWGCVTMIVLLKQVTPQFPPLL